MGQQNQEQDNKKTQVRKEDLTGKAEQSEAAIEQTERESHNKGAKDVTPEAHKEHPELKEAPESLKNSH
ncbi:hypothetical protein [Chitinophaga pinensis]|uniref:Uncharacterized protein n=1 Tax=Chitinophaga pinensis TaxID=79329 RepID=A0A5C6LQ34_9BACT|nr:hypothetical protein [Chitinophaga pinensis]TWV98717.1 hypothetical protein FEF09_20005 [Chitinophaga pinensis]